jgi:hypothetical protein
MRYLKSLGFASQRASALHHIMRAVTQQPYKLFSSGEALSLRQTSDRTRGIFRFVTLRITTLFGHRQRAVSLTKPTSMECETRLGIVASVPPS